MPGGVGLVLNLTLTLTRRPSRRRRSSPWSSMVKVQSGQCPSSAPVPPQGAPGGSGQLSTPRERPALWAPSHCLRPSGRPATASAARASHLPSRLFPAFDHSGGGAAGAARRAAAAQHGQSPSLAVPQLAPCASSGRAWWRSCVWEASTSRKRLGHGALSHTASGARASRRLHRL